jgi:hypothetical protein
MPDEPCLGCGEMSSNHPMVLVTRGEDGIMAAFPVCAACWQDPTHRQSPLKGHFFDRQSADAAVLAAENNILVY